MSDLLVARLASSLLVRTRLLASCWRRVTGLLHMHTIPVTLGPSFVRWFRWYWNAASVQQSTTVQCMRNTQIVDTSEPLSSCRMNSAATSFFHPLLLSFPNINFSHLDHPEHLIAVHTRDNKMASNELRLLDLLFLYHISFIIVRPVLVRISIAAAMSWSCISSSLDDTPHKNSLRFLTFGVFAYNIGCQTLRT